MRCSPTKKVNVVRHHAICVKEVAVFRRRALQIFDEARSHIGVREILGAILTAKRDEESPTPAIVFTRETKLLLIERHVRSLTF